MDVLIDNETIKQMNENQKLNGNENWRFNNTVGIDATPY